MTTHCRYLQSFAYTAFLSSSIWITCFGHALLICSKTQSTKVLTEFVKYYCWIAFVLPLIMGISSCFTDYVIYSADAKACVHRIYNNQVDVAFLIYAAFPIAFVCLISLVWYGFAAAHLKKLVGKVQPG